jgi:hypothetical protein
MSAAFGAPVPCPRDPGRRCAPSHRRPLCPVTVGLQCANSPVRLNFVETLTPAASSYRSHLALHAERSPPSRCSALPGPPSRRRRSRRKAALRSIGGCRRHRLTLLFPVAQEPATRSRPTAESSKPFRRRRTPPVSLFVRRTLAGFGSKTAPPHRTLASCPGK